MNDAAILALTRELDAAKKNVARLEAELRNEHKDIESFEYALERLSSSGVNPSIETEAPAPAKSGTRLIDKVLEEVKASDGTNARTIAEKLTARGRPTSENTVSSLLSKCRKAGDVKREPDGLFYFDPYGGL
jgi:hypothetical protein